MVLTPDPDAYCLCSEPAQSKQARALSLAAWGD